jgi:hypothetical protein
VCDTVLVSSFIAVSIPSLVCGPIPSVYSECDFSCLTTMLSMSVIVMVVGDTLPKTSASQPLIS